VGLDWSRDEVDWRDEPFDEAMPRDWLAATHDEGLPGSDVWHRVWELTHESLDPDRGWRLLKRMVQLADSDEELRMIGYYPLTHMLDYHEVLIAPKLERLYRPDPKWRRAFDGQMSQVLADFARRVDSVG